MTGLILLILAALWAAVLVPPVVRSRLEGRNSDSITDFSYRLGVLSQTGGFLAGDNPEPPSALFRPRELLTPAQRRRRDVLVVLATAVSATLLLATSIGSSQMWVANFFADAFFAAYAALLVRRALIAREQREKVRPINRYVDQFEFEIADADVRGSAHLKRASQ